MRRLRVDFVIADVTFILQNPDNLGFQLGVGYEDLDLLRVRAVAHASKQVCNWICNSTYEIQAACSCPAGPPSDGHAVASFFARSEKGIPSSLKSEDRKSTRLNSSHVEISYAVFCLK